MELKLTGTLFLTMQIPFPEDVPLRDFCGSLPVVLRWTALYDWKVADLKACSGFCLQNRR